MKHILARLANYTLATVIILLVFNLALYCVCLLDSEPMRGNIAASQAILEEQSGFNSVNDFFCVKGDNFAESLLINEMYSVDHNNPVESYMKARKNYRDGLTLSQLPDMVGEAECVYFDPPTRRECLCGYYYNQIEELSGFLADKIYISINYGRYWHGFWVVYRPLLTFCNVTQIRQLMLTAFVVLYLYFILLVYRRFGTRIAIIYGASLLWSGYFSAAFSLQCGLTEMAMIVGSILFIKRIDTKQDVGLFLFILACVTNYVDILTVPLISFGVVISLYLLKMREDGRGWKEATKDLVRYGLIWLAGFMGIWFVKWLIYDIVINDGQSMVHIGIEQFIYRVGTTNIYSEDNDNKCIYITACLLGRSTLGVLLTATVLLWTQRFKTKAVSCLNCWIMPFLTLACIPPLWYLLTGNHTVMHYFYTYRLTAVYMIGLLLAFNDTFFPADKRATSGATPPRPEQQS